MAKPQIFFEHTCCGVIYGTERQARYGCRRRMKDDGSSMFCNQKNNIKVEVTRGVCADECSKKLV
jgi:tRNA(Arg) A34 adenosine deaminase TadA